MIRKGALLCFMALVLFSGCQKQNETQIPQENTQSEEKEKPKVQLSENLWDFEFSIGEEVWQLPSEFSKWEEKGWNCDEKKKESMLDAESYMEGETLRKENQEMLVDFVNPEGEKKTLGECYVGGITLKYEETAPFYQLPSGIVLGESTITEVTDAFGTPTDEYEEKEDIYVTYKYGKYKEAELVFRMEDEVLYKVTMHNYREPENESDKISDEMPEEVKKYEEPQGYTSDFREYVVMYGDSFYQIPAPVSQFVQKGWTISKEGSDSYVKAGRHGYVTLEKDGQVLYAVVKNYSGQTVNIIYSFVTNLSGDFDVTKVPIGVCDEIVLGMSKEEAKSRLEENAYEISEEEKGESYFLYSDETKKNFIRIFVDKDLQLVREIEVSNSPEILYRAEEKEGEKTNNSDALLNEEKITEQ